MVKRLASNFCEVINLLLPVFILISSIIFLVIKYIRIYAKEDYEVIGNGVVNDTDNDFEIESSDLKINGV